MPPEYECTYCGGRVVERPSASTADVCKTCGTVWYADADHAPEDWTPCYCDLDRPSPSTAPGLKAHGDAAETPNACRNVSAAQEQQTGAGPNTNPNEEN